jgi:ABC-type multidrug transport system fused ATPase/permease subunit
LVRVRAELNAVLVDAVQGAGDLLAAGAGGRHLARVEQLGCEMGAHQGRLARVGSLGEALGGLAVNGATLAVVAAGIPLVRAGRVDGVFLAVVAMAAISAFEAILPLPAAFGQLEESLEAASRLVALVDADPAVVDPPQPQPLPAAPGVLAALPRGAPLLQVEGLAFAYEGDGADLATGAGALRGVDLCVPLGGLVAVVGPSGAGKSTLVNLLLRFWDYGQGRILLAGRDVRACAAADVRRLVSVVSQHTHLFNGTVRDNLLLASPGGDEEALVRAARQARIHEFVASLPHGYDTWIGEQGLRLSAGQRRRLAIARAILQDAPLLLLDEPTANLDALTERAVIGSLLALAGHASSGGRRATLWVTHRLAGLEAADEIVVLREGRVVERGRHHDLVAASDGLYSRMWQLQNQVLPGRLPDST